MATNPSENMWTEPESAANADTQPTYPYNNITETEGGHSFEMDDTPGRERIRIQHGKNANTFIEMHPNGDVVHRIQGDGYEVILGNKNVQINGVCNITINGDCNMHVLGNKNEQIDGDYNLIVAGNMTARAAGAGGMNLISDNDMTIAASSSNPQTNPSNLYLQVDDHIYVASDLQVAGAVSADTVSALTRINAGTGLYAGPSGVFSEGVITSLISVTAPTANFPVSTLTGLLDATWMTDTLNTKVFDNHTHIGNKGYPTSPPNTPML
jgi:hypothetical protein